MFVGHICPLISEWVVACFLEMEQEHYKEALVEFEKAQEVLLKHSEGIEYASMLAKMVCC